jgi:hypothetical protein
MGRLRGGYLGGSTIIHPGKPSGSSDDGPVAALERARIENERIGSESAARKAALTVADERIATVENEIYEIAFSANYGGKDPFANLTLGSVSAPAVHVDFEKSSDGTHMNSIISFLASELSQISNLGPAQRRKAKNIAEDVKRLNRALAADGKERQRLLKFVEVFQNRDWSRIVEIDRMYASNACQNSH